MPLTTDQKMLTLSRNVIEAFDKADRGPHPGFLTDVVELGARRRHRFVLPFTKTRPCCARPPRHRTVRNPNPLSRRRTGTRLR